MSNEIRECPFCGGPAKLITVYQPEKSAGERYRYVCNGLYEEPTRLCPKHKTGTIEQAAEAWNTRAAPASAAEPVGWQYRRNQAFLDTYPQASEYVMHFYSTEYEARVASLSTTDLVNGEFPQALIDAAIVRPVFAIDT